MSNEKTLNELKKATLASYLSKAGGRIRSATTIAGDFDNDYGKALATANKHSPNVYTPGVEKDPEKFKKAQTRMKVTGDLRDTYKRDAYNRVKGIARAGRLLAKEETINERNTESHPSLWDTHELRHESGKALKKGDKVKGFRGTYKIQGFEMPHHEGSTGRVYTDKGSFFPGVVNAKIVKKAVKEETVNEVSRSTIAKVATARYQQAQKALKDKNYGEYVTKMKKAIKAGDATTPKTGWSHEEETQLPEGGPIVELSATEKYRQIKEAKARKALRGPGPQPSTDEKPKMKDYYDYKGEGGKKKRPTMADLPANVRLHGG